MKKETVPAPEELAIKDKMGRIELPRHRYSVSFKIALGS